MQIDECIFWLSIIFITILCTPQPTIVRWSSTPPVTDEVLLQWKGFCAIIANAYYMRGMAWWVAVTVFRSILPTWVAVSLFTVERLLFHHLLHCFPTWFICWNFSHYDYTIIFYLCRLVSYGTQLFLSPNIFWCPGANSVSILLYPSYNVCFSFSLLYGLIFEEIKTISRHSVFLYSWRLPVKILQLEQMAVVGYAEEPSVVASRMRLVFSTLEVSSGNISREDLDP